ncbi:MAG: asparaginase [Acidobacteria bacterium]|nr:asparaginase [Acidobacteriota bacterium]
MLDKDNVVLVEITRGSIVESRHRGAIAIVDGNNQLVASVGDIDFVTYLRSSAKPHQAISVITSGATKHFDFTKQEIALMAGSHSGESYHADCALRILEKIKLPVNALCCGIHKPFSHKAVKELGKNTSELHNNCSGKHAGMLASALVGDYSLEDYYKIDHPVQKAIAKIIAEFANVDVNALIASIDGCSAATFAITIAQMALIYARLINPKDLRTELQEAAKLVTQAMLEFPEMVASKSERIDTDLMCALPGKLVAKAGAEGVYTIGLLPSTKYPSGLGIAIKIEDGDIGRARNAAILGTIEQLGVLDSLAIEQLKTNYLPPIKNHRGLFVGEVRPSFNLDLS